MDHYLIFIWQGVDVQLFGAFEDKEDRDKKAKQLRKEYGNDCGYFQLEITKGSQLEIDSYSGTFFEE